MSMFGSLVVVLPTEHEGGALALSHEGKEWTFDSANALANLQDPHTHIAYIAFFSDVEHAVTSVKSGYRVTLTYNLYFEDNATPAANTRALATLAPLNQSIVRSALQELIQDKEFLPEGGYIGFGLRHEYPIEIKPRDTNSIDTLARSLKGSDALIMQACKDLGLDTTLRLSFEWYKDEVLVKRNPDIDGQILWGHTPLVTCLVDSYEGKVIKVDKDDYGRDATVDFEVHWVTERARFNAFEASYGTYGNESGAEHVYGLFCLIVKVGTAENRSTKLA